MNPPLHTMLRDPTAETSGLRRERLAPLPALEGRSIGLLDIGKMRGNEFIDQLERRFNGLGIDVRRYRKPTNTRVAPPALLAQMAAETQAAVIALSD